MADPIVVHKTPTQPQLETALRTAVIALGSIAGALGYAGAASKLSGLAAFIGPVAAGVAFLWQQAATHEHAAKAAAMANMLPDDKAVAK